MSKDFFSKLPNTINVKIKKGLSGCYVIVLPEYNIFTEADSREEIDFQVNDLIYTYFNIPKKFQEKVWYRPVKQKSSLLEVNYPLSFKMFVEINSVDHCGKV